MRSQEADFVCFGSTVGSILVSKFSPNPPKMDAKPPKIEFGKPFWVRVRPGGVPGVSWGGLGGSRDSFWGDFGLPNSSKINAKLSLKNDAF